VVSTSNPTAAFSAFQTGPLLLYSSNYSVYPITRLSGPRYNDVIDVYILLNGYRIFNIKFSEMVKYNTKMRKITFHLIS
jgi:hypothetical protein